MARSRSDWVVDESLPDVLVLVEPHQRLADQRCRRAHPAGEQQLDHRENFLLGDRPVVDLLLQQRADHVVLRFAAPRRDDLAHLLGQVRQLDLGRPLVLLAARHRGQHCVVSERVARPVLHRQAEPVDGDDRRNADHLGEVALAGLDHLIDEPRRVRRDQVRHPLDRGRRRERVDELAVLAELRRVDLDRDVQVHRRLRDDDRQPLAAVRVARRGEDVVVTRCLEHGVVSRHDPVAAVRLGPGDRALLPQLAVRGDGVLGVLLGVVVELHLGLMGVRSRHAFRTSGQGLVELGLIMVILDTPCQCRRTDVRDHAPVRVGSGPAWRCR